MENLLKIGIIGYGIVGKAIEHAFKGYADFIISDPAYNKVTIEEVYRDSYVVFICVPTPMKLPNSGGIDTSIIDLVMESLSKCSMNAKTFPVICIKSTVIPSKLKEYRKKYHSLRLTMSPEYLTEAKYLEDVINMKALVVGGDNPRDRAAIINLFEHDSNCKKGYPVGECDLIAAGILKYMENCYLALKVSFMNQMYDVLQKSGSKTNWEDVAKIFHLDTRMGNSHYKVPGPDGDRGYGGKCFPKDINAMIDYAKSLSVNVSLLEKSWEENLKIRKNKDWHHIKGAISDGVGNLRRADADLKSDGSPQGGLGA